MRREAHAYRKRLKGATTVMHNTQSTQSAKRWGTVLGSLRQIPRRLRANRALLPLALTLILILGLAALLGALGQQRANATMRPSASAPLLVARADYHSETVLRGQDLEMNVAISQTGNDCQAALNGGVCLRYSVVLDERPVMAGYGVIPMADVKVTSTMIKVTVDTRKVPNFVHTVGTGGQISVTWKTSSPPAGAAASAQVNKPQKATVQGGIASYSLPSSGVVATIIYR